MRSDLDRVLADLRRLDQELAILIEVNERVDDAAAAALLEAVLDDADKALEEWRRLRKSA